MVAPSELGVVRALICEDEPLARRALEEYLRDVEWVRVEATASDGRQALRLIHKLEPDLVFLDVQMPGLSGLEVLDALEHRPAIVFTTAFDEYAISAFEHGAIDYLVKPFGRDRLVRTLDRVRVRLAGEGVGASEDPTVAASGRFPERVFARHRGAAVPVSVRDVRRIEAVDGGVVIHAGERTLDLDSTLGEVAKRLDPRDFIRVHRSHVVNLAHVRSIKRYDDRRLVVRMNDDSTIIASRTGSQSLRSLME
jgi:two-component system LytT family response regulator